MGFFDLFKKNNNQQNVVRNESSMVVNTLGDYGFYLVVEDVFTVTGKGTVVVGRVTKGQVGVGDTVTLKNSGIQTVVTGIEMFRKQLDYATEGDNVGLLISNVSRNDVSSGEIIYK